ncbi:acetolactate synthase-1/2/3 large subunit [Saccharopolyspora antimicrobica]|uniref:Acetolactate synthase-1/2/3 large subunit n=1 Tax=Saccharopolyspora antimicrobica TaxID=455193 RepID=A0A1I4VZY1_9PSEU|nr:thiamine pyrophosphate-binding protein [Saccharopolyspora antimicrobica]RKT87138.1 acetolactate synthase-1/2/3 large subunit [Saccharopolyspora antimicrobica]SFN06750.1 acetolactate synthase-1/2/3 large subunit [Saccharopolyspora antimicrobica]
MDQGTGGDLLVQVMRDNGVDTAFGVVSVHNLPLVEAVSRELRFVPVRHEAAAVNAADGCARATGGLGVAITSTGTGAGNAAGALVEALTAGSRVLHVTGQIDSCYLGQGRGVIHETRDQLGMLTAVSKHAAAITSVEAAEEELRRAVRSAVSPPRGPSSVEWPIDLQYAKHRFAPAASEQAEATAPVDQGAIRRAAELIRAARRPLLWVGGGGTQAGEALRELAERLHAGVLTSNSGRGSLPEDHGLVVGNFATNPKAAPMLAEADLLISVGTHFRSNETKHYALELPEKHVQIDVDPTAIGRVHPATVGLVGAADEVLQQLNAQLDGTRTDRRWRSRVEHARTEVRNHLRDAIGPYAQICDALRRTLPAESVIARDVTIPSSQWGNRLLEIHHPNTNIFPVGGGIGQGLAHGIGASVGTADAPTVVLVGDGGLAVHLGELATLAQEQPWLVLVVFNDGGYGVLRNMQDKHVGRRSGVDLFTPDFGRLADSLHLPHALVNKAGSFAEVFAKAVDHHGPYVVEVDVTALEPTPEPFVPPVHVPS